MAEAREQEIVLKMLLEKGDQAGVLAFLTDPWQNTLPFCVSVIFYTDY